MIINLKKINFKLNKEISKKYLISSCENQKEHKLLQKLW